MSDFEGMFDSDGNSEMDAVVYGRGLDAVAGYQQRIAPLEAENARLREGRDDMIGLLTTLARNPRTMQPIVNWLYNHGDEPPNTSGRLDDAYRFRLIQHAAQIALEANALRDRCEAPVKEDGDASIEN